MIGLLREPSDPEPGPESGPGNGLAGIGVLVDRAAEAGLDVRLQMEGEAVAAALPRAVDRAAYRVVQEAPTNVAEHAPAPRATVVAHLAADGAGARVDALTARERDVLGLLGGGLSNGQIARCLHLADGTVKAHVSSILARLGVGNRAAAAVVAHEAGAVLAPPGGGAAPEER
ncbi:LuxR C-terminal-related transcriptional regulator [Streptomyces xanthophaeus]|uniref:LuxR C-terminal-related transcriptional regulator n=1 Tax=Streptomyces xanthophaeus TaxID=67385 RepID=UPI003F5A1D41